MDREELIDIHQQHVVTEFPVGLTHDGGDYEVGAVQETAEEEYRLLVEEVQDRIFAHLLDRASKPEFVKTQTKFKISNELSLVLWLFNTIIIIHSIHMGTPPKYLRIFEGSKDI